MQVEERREKERKGEERREKERKGEDCYMFDMSRIPLVSMTVLSFSSFFYFLEFQIS